MTNPEVSKYWLNVKNKACELIKSKGDIPDQSWNGLATQVAEIMNIAWFPSGKNGKGRQFLGNWARKSLGIYHPMKRDLPKNKKRKESVKQKEWEVSSKNFYKSWEWKEIRYQALLMHGRKCMCCGAGPEDGKVMAVDHIIPRSKAPRLELDIHNLQVLCNDCNMGKSNKDETDFRQENFNERLPEGGYDHMMALRLESLKFKN